MLLTGYQLLPVLQRKNELHVESILASSLCWGAQNCIYFSRCFGWNITILSLVSVPLTNWSATHDANKDRRKNANLMIEMFELLFKKEKTCLTLPPAGFGVERIYEPQHLIFTSGNELEVVVIKWCKSSLNSLVSTSPNNRLSPHPMRTFYRYT